MDHPPDLDEVMVLRAAQADVPLLVSHHVKMFEEIRELRGETCDAEKMAQMEAHYRAKLGKQLYSGECAAWIAKANGRVAASGAVSFLSMVPTPEDPTDQVVYFHSLYTEKDFRKRGLARRILETAIAYSRQKGVRRIQLGASAAGRPLYESLGFTPMPEAMRLLLD